MSEGKSDPLALFTRMGAVNPAKPPIGTDPIRTQRDEERRERLGQLRAREHSGKRPRKVNLFFA